MSLIIGCSDFYSGRVALVVDIPFGLRRCDDIAARADKTRSTIDRASCGVRYLRLKPVGIIPGLLLVRRRNREFNIETAISIKMRVAVLNHVVTVPVAAALLILASVGADCIVFLSPPPVVIARSINVV